MNNEYLVHADHRRVASIPTVSIPLSELQAMTAEFDKRIKESNCGQPVIHVTRFTPALASFFLKKNMENRAVIETRIQAYMRDMAAGNWQLNGETIKIDKDGRLVDGQHRMIAILRAKIEITLMVCYGVSDEAVPTIDQGKSRTVGDALVISGISNGKSLAQIISFIMEYDGRGDVAGVHAFRATTTKALDFYAANQEMLDKACGYARAKSASPYGGTAPATFLAFLLLRRGVATEALDLFFDRLKTGAGLSEGNPILVYRDRVAGRAKTSVYDRIVLLARAWNSIADGRLSITSLSKEGGMPKIREKMKSLNW